MGLREKLLQETKGQRVGIGDIRGRFRVHVGDTFNSSICSLLEDTHSLTLDQALTVADESAWFLPDLLEKGILGFVKSNKVIEPGVKYRYRVTEVLNKSIDDIPNTFIAEPIAQILPEVSQVCYVHFEEPRIIQPIKREIIRPTMPKIYRSCIPPYPPNFYFPEGAKSARLSGTDFNNKINFPILMGIDVPYGSLLELNFGDTFNAIVMSFKGERADFRIFQFRPWRYLGYAQRHGGIRVSDIPSLPYDCLHVNLVYRFEIIQINKGNSENIFYARPLAVDFRKGPYQDSDQNVIYNMTHTELRAALRRAG